MVPSAPRSGWKLLHTVPRRQSCSQSPTSRSLPLHNFSNSRGNKTTHNPTTIWCLPTSKHERCWRAQHWQPQRPIFHFLCCCFKSKARIVIGKHRNTDTLPQGENHVRSKHIAIGCFPAFIPEGNGAWLQSPGGNTQEMPTGSPTSVTVNSHCDGLPLPHGYRKRLPLELSLTWGCRLMPAKQMWPDA